MKTRRFFSVFLLCALIVTLFATPLSAAAETEAKTPPDPGISSKAALLVDANMPKMSMRRCIPPVSPKS